MGERKERRQEGGDEGVLWHTESGSPAHRNGHVSWYDVISAMVRADWLVFKNSSVCYHESKEHGREARTIIGICRSFLNHKSCSLLGM